VTPERWEILQRLFHAALELEPGEREAFLAKECAGDPALVAEVLSLLADDGARNETLQGVVGRAAHGVVDGAARPNSRIGSYRVVRELGHGGMGRVVLAERDDDLYQQQVAIKLLRSSVLSEDAIRLFAAERQTLAQLSHPNIAMLLDGGTADDGTPYVVMQFIDGKPLTEYADAQNLSVRQRLQLFLKICAAVSHAHRNLIVHRDVKPSNILVDPIGEPKLLDFGISKMLDDSGAAKVTQAGLMTPEYASPEQVDGQPISIATDVYSLGAVLFELLTGEPPFRLRNTSPSEVASVIRSTIPPLPSDAVKVRTIAAKELRGDLDNIVHKAMRKEPERRYEDVSALADDLKAWLDGRPVAARPDTFGYRLQKFVTRNAAMVSVVSFAVLTLIAGATFYTLRLQDERDRALAAEIEATAAAELADRRAATANRVSDFLVGLFEASDVRASGRRDISARELLDAGYRRIGDDLQDEPGIKSHLLRVMGLAYAHMGAYADAIPLLEESLALKRIDPDSSQLDVAEALNRLAEVLRQQGNNERASELQEQAIGIREALSTGPSWGLGDSYNNFGLLQYSMGRYVRAEEYLRKAIDTHRNAHDQKLRSIGISMHNLALVQRQLGHFETALETMNEALEVIEQADYDGTAVEAVSLELATRIRIELADYSGAAGTLERALAIARRVYDEDNPRMGAMWTRAGTLQCEQGKFADALKHFDDGLAVYAASHGTDSWNYAYVQKMKADCLLLAGDPPAAEGLLRQSIAIREQQFGAAHILTGLAEVSLGVSLLDQGQTQAANDALQSAMAKLATAFDDQHPEVLRTRLALARLDTLNGDAGQATAALNAIADTLAQRAPNPLLVAALNALGDAQAAGGNRSAADASRQRAAEAQAVFMQ
jgi:eukaryotic-like serine/threonine-protein kinase